MNSLMRNIPTSSKKNVFNTQIINTWKKAHSEYFLQTNSDLGLFWQYLAYIWKSSFCNKEQMQIHYYFTNMIFFVLKKAMQASVWPTMVVNMTKIWACFVFQGQHAHWANQQDT